MRLITTQNLIKNIVKAWSGQYPNAENSEPEIIDQLKKLNLDKVNEATITKIIGNDSWTSIKCNECHTYIKKAIQLGEESNYSSSRVIICLERLKKANKLLYER